MDSSSVEFERLFNMFEKIFMKFGIWPGLQVKPIRYIILAIFIIFCILLPIKMYLNPERESIENGMVNAFGCFMGALFAIRLTVSEKQFIDVFEFVRNDLKRTKLKVTDEIFGDICGDIHKLIKFVTYVFPMAIIPKLLVPFLEYSFMVIKEYGSNVSVPLILPPSMALPSMPFLYYDDLIIYVLEWIVRTVMLLWLLSAASLFAISSLYIGSQFRQLALDLDGLSIDNKEAFEDSIKRHGELLSITKKLTNLYNIHLLAECVVTYINLAILFVSMFAAQRGMINFMNDMLLTLAGGSQFVFINFFGEKLMNASMTVFDGAYSTDWTGKSLIQQKKLAFMISRARKPCKLIVSENFVTASLELMMNIFRDSYAAFNILKTTVEK